MQKYDVITLIQEDPEAHGVFDAPQETGKTVYCEVRSASRSETYSAMAIGLNPQYVFVLSIEEDYNNEKDVIYHGDRYKVIRTYVSNDGIELTVEAWHGPDQDSAANDGL